MPFRQRLRDGGFMDYLVRATAAEGQVRAFAVNSTDMVSYAQKVHGTTPVASAALGRLLTGGVMMGSMMKDEGDLLTLQVRSEGPLKGMIVTADSQGHAKGSVTVPTADVPPKYAGKLDVGAAVGPGILQVVRDLGLKEPYSSQVPLQTGEIGDDLTYYFAMSEQVPSAVGLGVLVDTDWSILTAGGFIVQLMPFAEEGTIEKLEQNVGAISSVTDLLQEGYTPEMLLEKVLDGMSLEITDKMPVSFYCGCSKERFAGALEGIQAKDLQEMIDDGEPIEVVCHFCNSKYTFTPDELREILARRNK